MSLFCLLESRKTAGQSVCGGIEQKKRKKVMDSDNSVVIIAGGGEVGGGRRYRRVSGDGKKIKKKHSVFRDLIVDTSAELLI